jgi:formamidopyrimidine-DNA glycosylase
VLYQSRIHPEQYSNTLPISALKLLHEKIHTVTTTAAAVLGDSEKFPSDWLFIYRWGKGRGKGKKGQGENNVLPNGEKIVHITVGGRTSAVVESRQKKIKEEKDIPDTAKEVSSDGKKSAGKRKSSETGGDKVTPKRRKSEAQSMRKSPRNKS